MRGIGPSRIHPLHLGMVLVALAMLAIMTFAGCLEADKAVQDVNTVATTAKTILDSPAGQFIPPDIRFYATLALGLLAGGTAAFKQWRLKQMSKTTKAIVRGVERAVGGFAGNADNPLPVKSTIAAEMRKLGIYDAGNKLVDRLKTS